MHSDSLWSLSSQLYQLIATKITIKLRIRVTALILKAIVSSRVGLRVIKFTIGKMTTRAAWSKRIWLEKREIAGWCVSWLINSKFSASRTSIYHIRPYPRFRGWKTVKNCFWRSKRPLWIIKKTIKEFKMNLSIKESWILKGPWFRSTKIKINSNPFRAKLWLTEQKRTQ